MWVLAEGMELWVGDLLRTSASDIMLHPNLGKPPHFMGEHDLCVVMETEPTHFKVLHIHTGIQAWKRYSDLVYFDLLYDFDPDRK